MLGDFLRKNRKKVKGKSIANIAELSEDTKLLNEQSSVGISTELDYTGYEDEDFNKALDNMHLQYQLGAIPKLNKTEREILEFCDARNMREFIKEEFEKHPIILNDNGELVGENPFEKERRMQKTETETLY